MVRLIKKDDEVESKTAPINNCCLNGDKKKTHYRIGNQAALSEMRSLQFSLHGRNPNAEIVSSIQLARRIRGVQAWKNRLKNDPRLMDYTQAVDKCEPDDLKNDFFPRGRDLLPKGSSIVRLLTVTSTRNYWLADSSSKFTLKTKFQHTEQIAWHFAQEFHKPSGKKLNSKTQARTCHVSRIFTTFHCLGNFQSLCFKPNATLIIRKLSLHFIFLF